jgi:hypothetical protein
MALSMKSRRLGELRRRLESQKVKSDPVKQLAALEEMLAIGTIGEPYIVWASKYVLEMRDAYQDNPAAQVLINKINERIVAANARRSKRAAIRAEAKSTTPQPKKFNTQPAPASPSPNFDPWDL